MMKYSLCIGHWHSRRNISSIRRFFSSSSFILTRFSTMTSECFFFSSFVRSSRSPYVNRQQSNEKRREQGKAPGWKTFRNTKMAEKDSSSMNNPVSIMADTIDQERKVCDEQHLSLFFPSLNSWKTLGKDIALSILINNNNNDFPFLRSFLFTRFSIVFSFHSLHSMWQSLLKFFFIDRFEKAYSHWESFEWAIDATTSQWKSTDVEERENRTSRDCHDREWTMCFFLRIFPKYFH